MVNFDFIVVDVLKDFVNWLEFYNGVVVGLAFWSDDDSGKFIRAWIVFNWFKFLMFLYVGVLMVFGLNGYLLSLIVIDLYRYFV